MSHMFGRGVRSVEERLARNNTSRWLGIGVLLVCSTMMHPTLASLIAIFTAAVLVYLMRRISRAEGRLQEAQLRVEVADVAVVGRFRHGV